LALRFITENIQHNLCYGIENDPEYSARVRNAGLIDLEIAHQLDRIADALEWMKDKGLGVEVMEKVQVSII